MITYQPLRRRLLSPTKFCTLYITRHVMTPTQSVFSEPPKLIRATPHSIRKDRLGRVWLWRQFCSATPKLSGKALPLDYWRTLRYLRLLWWVSLHPAHPYVPLFYCSLLFLIRCFTLVAQSHSPNLPPFALACSRPICPHLVQYFKFDFIIMLLDTSHFLGVVFRWVAVSYGSQWPSFTHYYYRIEHCEWQVYRFIVPCWSW